MHSVFRPLLKEAWGQPFTPSSQRRSRWTFKAGWADTINLLDREVDYLGAKSFVIEADFREQDIRLDGMPRSNARSPEFPGIRVSFESKHGPLQYQTDTCAFWQHNVRSIALGLEALRAVDRYGITSRAEQYTGFKAIESGGLGTRAAEAIVRKYAGPKVSDSLQENWKHARRHTHPDKHGGDHTLWNELEEAGKVLGLL